MPDPTPPSPDLPRRAVLGALAAGAAAAAVGGCSTAAPTPSGAARSPGLSPARPARPRAVTPDVAVAVSAYARIGQVTEVLDRATRHHHALRHRLAGLAALHDAHQRMLQSAVPEDHRPASARAAGRGRVARRRGEALQAVVTAEHGLRSSLEDLAVRAQSGEFARLLAAMSAAIGQQLAVLDGAAA